MVKLSLGWFMYLAQITWPVLGQLDHASHSSTSLAWSTIISTPFPCFLVSLYSSSTSYSERGIRIDGNRKGKSGRETISEKTGTCSQKVQNFALPNFILPARSAQRRPRSAQRHPRSTHAAPTHRTAAPRSTHGEATHRTAAPTQHTRGAHAPHSGAHVTGL